MTSGYGRSVELGLSIVPACADLELAVGLLRWADRLLDPGHTCTDFVFGAGVTSCKVRAPAAQQLVDPPRADQRLVGKWKLRGWRMNGFVCGPPMPPWKEISSSNAQPSSSSGS